MTVLSRDDVVPADGRRLAVGEAGDPGRRVVLYLHGAGS